MHADTTPERIEDAALRLFLRQGVKKTNLDEVAHQAGVTRITVYRHYGDRRGLVRAVCRRIAAIFERAATGAAGDSTQDVDARLQQLGAELSALPAGDLLARLDEISRQFPEAYAEFRTAREAAVNRIFRQALAAGTREGTLRPGINQDVLQAIFSAAVVGLIENPALISSHVSMPEVFTTVTDLFWHGVLQEPRGGKRHGPR